MPFREIEFLLIETIAVEIKKPFCFYCILGKSGVKERLIKLGRKEKLFSKNNIRRIEKMVKKTSIPVRNQKKVIQESGGICAFCGEADVATLEFHHINGRDVTDPHNVDNLIYVCKNCHGKITAGYISLSDVVLQKRILKYNGNPNLSQAPGNSINVNESINTGTIANVIHIHSQKKTPPKLSPPQGSIGANLNDRNYVKYLIDRYHEFAKTEKSNAYKYPVFYQSIKRKFGAKWDMIPNNRFDDVITFVQKRIDSTILGKTRKSRGQKNYSTYSEYHKKFGDC